MRHTSPALSPTGGSRLGNSGGGASSVIEPPPRANESGNQKPILLRGILCFSLISDAVSAVISGDVNWKSVAWGAGVGAITGSTGVVGKVSRFIASLF